VSLPSQSASLGVAHEWVRAGESDHPALGIEVRFEGRETRRLRYRAEHIPSGIFCLARDVEPGKAAALALKRLREALDEEAS
jgi:hypothetical protein